MSDQPIEPTRPDLTPRGRLSTTALAELVAANSLDSVGGRPRWGVYLRELWRSRAFTWELASASAYARNQDNRLGQLWLVLNPLLSVGAYFLVFGLLLETDRGVDNFLAFLTVGVFIFSFISDTVTVGSRSVLRNQGMIRAMRFPRAALPISATMTELLQLIPAIGALLVILPFTGEPIRWTWLLLLPALMMLLTFCAGVALLMARIVASSRDLANLVPVIMRIARYVSGVFFNVASYAGDGAIGLILQYQPIAIFLDLFRSCVMVEVPVQAGHWVAAGAWTLIALVGGLIYFWRGEGTYGRG